MLFLWLPLLFVLLHGWGLLRIPKICFPRNTSRALVVVAHPDDESLFFANYITSAVRAGVQVHILCLSTGNADGLGKVREKELLRACALLQIPRDRVTILDQPRLQDGFHEWDTSAVAPAVAAAVKAVQPDELVTFDAGGVSGHPNHTSIFRAVRDMVDSGASPSFAAAGSDVGRGASKPCCVYVLVTHPLLVKFSGPLGAALLLLLLLRAHLLQGRRRWQPTPQAAPAQRPTSGRPGSGPAQVQAEGPLVFATSNPVLPLRAMCCHWSQFVWYRLLFILFSTYTYVNLLQPLGTLSC
ncbi:hypothetical protein HYH02_000024 [Chlamydomonas schloesseri]|uniref:N-acetylglucosaminylphosphatidylinositol deacetylase n=1 Tax=Chlamydomonas schloesseri TaxID=2026947 RepID=A0A836B805_9CHLO|nr:hypothetical protein HYH02_000024 [Chlamydomonas schloesseri]|eukprot:KAG2449919.1 hypothetical protein HYH02_000024 [Chlamydomonas schloesseri]